MHLKKGRGIVFFLNLSLSLSIYIYVYHHIPSYTYPPSYLIVSCCDNPRVTLPFGHPISQCNIHHSIMNSRTCSFSCFQRVYLSRFDKGIRWQDTREIPQTQNLKIKHRSWKLSEVQMILVSSTKMGYHLSFSSPNGWYPTGCTGCSGGSCLSRSAWLGSEKSQWIRIQCKCTGATWSWLLQLLQLVRWTQVNSGFFLGGNRQATPANSFNKLCFGWLSC